MSAPGRPKRPEAPTRRLSLESRLRLLTMVMPNGCHRWIGRKDGKIRVGKRDFFADELALSLALKSGKPRSAPMACGNERCINPKHTFGCAR